MTDFHCPVTLESFTEPRVLGCGHTIDGHILESMKEPVCPLCRETFYLPPPINWAIVDALGLKITTHPSKIHVYHPSGHRKAPLNATRMASVTLGSLNRMLDVNRSLFFSKITRSSRAGLYSCSFHMSEMMTPFFTTRACKHMVMGMLHDYFESLHFTVSMHNDHTWMMCFPDPCLTLSWAPRMQPNQGAG